MGAATILITAGIHLYGDAPDAFVLLYVPVAVAAFYWLPASQASLQLALIAAGYAAVLAESESPRPAIGHWTLGIAVMGLLGAGASQVVRRIDRATSRVADLARMDPLTALPNRRGFDELFATECERVRRSGRLVSLLVGEVDGLEAVNERFGHVVGDHILECVAAALHEGKRRIDTAARIGGSDFAVIVPDASEQGAYLVAERVRAAFARLLEEKPGGVAIRFGVASSERNGQTETALLSAAERALYAARALSREFVIEGADLPGTIVSVGGRNSIGHGWLGVMLALAETMDLKEFAAGGHSRRVGRYAGMIARELGLDGETVKRVELAGALHDVGKAIVPDSVLAKPAPLTEDEWKLVRRHPSVGAEMLDEDGLEDLRDWVLAHQERPDGDGYPLGSKGRQIPLGAKIIAVADAYEAMTSERSYRAAMSQEDAQSELARCAGRQFDKRVADALVRALNKQGLRRRHPRAA
jgi:two-component system cell cycle response regulator